MYLYFLVIYDYMKRITHFYTYMHTGDMHVYIFGFINYMDDM